MAPSTHASRNSPGAWSVRIISAGTMKIPAPIMEPATNATAPVRVIALTKWGGSADEAVVIRS